MMNERIKELVEEAEQYAFTDGVGIQSQHWRNKFNEKFAELIVNQCAAMARGFECAVGREGLSAAMREHFGVE